MFFLYFKMDPTRELCYPTIFKKIGDLGKYMVVSCELRFLSFRMMRVSLDRSAVDLPT